MQLDWCRRRPIRARRRASGRAGPSGKDGEAAGRLRVAADMFRAPESKGDRAGSRCGAGAATVT